jgi:hypothetical protein
MGRDARVKLIGELEQEFDSRIITLILGDRAACPTQIADDCIRPIYDHVLPIGHVPRIQLLLYSLGGLTEAPWKIVNTLRPFCDAFEVIVPYKAYSAATMICMGADKIHMTRKSELGPIDPSLMINPGSGAQPPLVLPDLGVEDVASYVSFLRNRVGLTDQTALSQLTAVLATTLTPPLLGRVERVYSHIRLVSRKLLDLRRPPLEDRVITSIIQALTEKTYVHNHGIGRDEAKLIGMQVEFLGEQAEDKVWRLFCDYEEALRLNETRDVESLIPDGSDEYKEPDAISAFVETSGRSHGFAGTLSVRRVRRIPQQPTININLQLQMPPGVDPTQIPQNVQATLQQLLAQGSKEVQQIVTQEINRQSPVEKIEVKMIGGGWKAL